MSAVTSSFKRTANNPRRFDKTWRINDRIWKHIAKTKQDGSCVQFDARKKKIKLCSASRMTLRAWNYRTDPQNTGGQFESERRAKESPEIYFGTKSLRTIFEKRISVYSLGLHFSAWLNPYIIFSRRNVSCGISMVITIWKALPCLALFI